MVPLDAGRVRWRGSTSHDSSRRHEQSADGDDGDLTYHSLVSSNFHDTLRFNAMNAGALSTANSSGDVLRWDNRASDR